MLTSLDPDMGPNCSQMLPVPCKNRRYLEKNPIYKYYVLLHMRRMHAQQSSGAIGRLYFVINSHILVSKDIGEST